jgi:hypothetical protein
MVALLFVGLFFSVSANWMPKRWTRSNADHSSLEESADDCGSFICISEELNVTLADGQCVLYSESDDHTHYIQPCEANGENSYCNPEA